jgi:putative ABC transport system permease protein
MTVRAVLGAPSSRILRQLMTESMMLGLASGAVGLLAATGGLRILQAMNPGGVPRLTEIGIDPRVFGFALIVSIATAVLTGIVPALHAIRSDPATGLKGATRSVTSSIGQGRLRGGLVVMETAMAIVLVLGSGLLFNSFVRLMRVDPGFDPTGVASIQVDLRYATGMDREQWLPFFNDLLGRVRAMPRVRSAALTVQVPFTDDGIVSGVYPEGIEKDASDEVWIPMSGVSDEFFETMRIPLLQGRVIEARDRATSQPIAVVNQAFVRQYWPDASSALGKTVAEGGPDEPVRRVVGVVGDLRYSLGRDPLPHIYIPFEESWPTMSVVVRVSGDVHSFASTLRGQVRTLAPNLPISRVASIEELAMASLGQQRFYVVLTGVFGIIALVLALTGIYGTTSYSAGLRTREIGIRIALGAEPTAVQRLIVKRALVLVSLGLVIGVSGSVVASRLLEAFLFEIGATDLPTFTTGAVFVTLAAGVAAWVPARRATRADATLTLRNGG